MLPLLALISWQTVADEAMRGTQGAMVIADIATGKALAVSGSQADRLAAPGSAIKPFVLTATRDRQPGRCERKLEIEGRSFTCSHPQLATAMDARAALAYSCNAYFAALGSRLDPRRLADSLRGFGFQVDDPATEPRRKLLALGAEGVRVSPRALASAYARLAREHSRGEIADGLADSVEFGMAQLAAAEGVRVAGKTGTVSTPGRTSTHAWFAGWAPAEKPEIVVVVFVDRGRGGASAAPAASRVFSELRPRRAPLPPGTVTVKLFRDSKIVAMSMEDYTDGVLGGEASGMHPEAMKAMAVSARTYAWTNRGRHRAEGFDFCESTHCQDLRLGGRSAKTRAAVESTEGEMLWHEGSPARIFYHKDCSGITEASGEIWSNIRVPYLTQLRDPFCGREGRAPWRTVVSARELAAVGRTTSGRVIRVRLDGRLMGYEDFQRATGNAVKSPLFQISRTADGFSIEGRGEGHGVGLCQRGAEERARQGHDYRRILDAYFPGTRAGIGAQGLRWMRFTAPKLEVMAAGDVRQLMDPASRAVREAESRTGHSLREPVRLRVYPTLAAYRDATGEPGWVAASTLGRTIRLQPPEALAARGALESTLLHEMLHVAVRDRARAPVPAWFEEGLVLYLADPGRPAGNTPLIEAHVSRPPDEASMRRAYDAARSRVKRLVDRYGRPAVLTWLDRGLPAEIARSSATQPATAAP